MNDLGRETLMAAQMRGVRQITHSLTDDNGGVCAMGALVEGAGYDLREFVLDRATSDRSIGRTAHVLVRYGMLFTPPPCPACGAEYYPGRFDCGEWNLVVHLNNDHGMTFLDIARKMPDTEVPA